MTNRQNRRESRTTVGSPALCADRASEAPAPVGDCFPGSDENSASSNVSQTVLAALNHPNVAQITSESVEGDWERGCNRPNGGRTLEFTHMNIEPIILKNKIEDMRETGAGIIDGRLNVAG